MPEEYGGGGADFLYSAVMIEEMAKRVFAAPGFRLHSDIVAPYIFNYGSEEQKRTWLPRMAKGEVITAIAMTEPGTGSDLQAIRTTALRKGNELVVNGQKTFITNGGLADLVIVAAKTDTAAGAKGVTPGAGRDRPAGLQARAQPQEDRPERAGHRRAVLRGRARAAIQHPGRGGPRLRLPDEPAAARAPAGRHRRRRP